MAARARALCLGAVRAGVAATALNSKPLRQRAASVPESNEDYYSRVVAHWGVSRYSVLVMAEDAEDEPQC
eukprot:6173753-Pleurochrysis_carterae.AAC.1